jgi:hypothetical protein
MRLLFLVLALSIISTESFALNCPLGFSVDTSRYASNQPLAGADGYGASALAACEDAKSRVLDSVGYDSIVAAFISECVGAHTPLQVDSPSEVTWDPPNCDCSQNSGGDYSCTVSGYHNQLCCYED